MPYNGSGTFNRVVAAFSGPTLWRNQADAQAFGGELGPINPDYFDIQDQDFATGLSTAITKDGQTVPTANLPMGGFKHTGVGAATAADQYATMGQLQAGGPTWGGDATGTANAIAIAVNPPITSLAAGMSVRFKAASTNLTGGVTVNVSGLGAVGLRSPEAPGNNLFPGEIAANQVYDIVFNGTFWFLANNAGRLTKTWTPTYPTSGAVTWFTGVTAVTNLYQRHPGNICEVWLISAGTTGGTATPQINVTGLPFASSSANCVGIASITDGAAYAVAQCFIQGSTMVVRNATGTNWGIGAGRGMNVWARYEVAF